MNDDREGDKQSEDDSGQRIKVTDRRHFDREGNLKADVPQDNAAKTEEGTQVTEPVETERPAEDDEAASEAPATATGGEPRVVRPEGQSLADLPRDFSSFVEGLYLEAMLYLGALADPHSGELIEDLELAQYKIDILGMVQEKTEGNLTQEEKQQLDEILYQLRMVFLQKTK